MLGRLFRRRKAAVQPEPERTFEVWGPWAKDCAAGCRGACCR